MRKLSVADADFMVRVALLRTGVNFDGSCYIAAEAVYHLAGKRDGWTPAVLRLSKRSKYRTHWFLQKRKGESVFIVDPTEAQFSRPPSYRRARGCGFLTKRPSKRARVLIRRVRRMYGNRG